MFSRQSRRGFIEKPSFASQDTYSVSDSRQHSSGKLFYASLGWTPEAIHKRKKQWPQNCGTPPDRGAGDDSELIKFTQKYLLARQDWNRSRAVSTNAHEGLLKEISKFCGPTCQNQVKPSQQKSQVEKISFKPLINTHTTRNSVEKIFRTTKSHPTMTNSSILHSTYPPPIQLHTDRTTKEP